MVKRVDEGVSSVVKAELRERAVDPRTDVHRLVEEFVSNEPGARILYSKGRGEVSILLPERDEYQDMDRLNFFAPANSTNILYVAKRSPTPIEVEGIGRCYEFVIEPLKFKHDAKALAGSDAAHARIGFAGDGFTPFGFDDAFFQEYVDVLCLLANEGGVRIGGDQKADKRDGNWKKLGKEELAFVERHGGHVGGNVVSTKTIAKALEAAAIEEDARKGAKRSLELVLDDPEATEGEHEVKLAHKTALDEARPTLEKLLGGTGALDPEDLTRELILVADGALQKQGNRGDEMGALRELLREKDVDPERVGAALDAAFGRGFYAKRQPTAALIEALLDQKMKELEFGEIDVLRTLRAEIRNVARAQAYGVDPKELPLAGKSAASKMREVHRALMKVGGVGEAAAQLLARDLVVTANTKNAPPRVIIIADGGRSADAAFRKALELTGAKKPVLYKGLELGGRDPVGLAVGSPDGQVGLMRGLMVRDAKSDERYVMGLDGQESVGAATSDGDERANAQAAWWRHLSDIERNSNFLGFDPTDPKRKSGVDINLKGGILIIRDRRKPAEILESMPLEVRRQLGARVIDFGEANGAAVLAGIMERIREHMVSTLDIADAEVELEDSTRAFVTGLVARGIDPAVLEELVLQETAPALLFSAIDGELVPKVRIGAGNLELLMDDERENLEESWLKGQPVAIPGVGGTLFNVYDAGRTMIDRKTRLSASVEMKIKRDRGREELQKKVDRLLDSAEISDRTIRKLVLENAAANSTISADGVQIKSLGFDLQRAVWEVEDMRRVNEEAKRTINKLEKDVKKANDRIEELNQEKVRLQERYERALSKANWTIEQQNREKADLQRAGEEIDRARRTAMAERDEIHRTLRSGESSADAAMATIAKSLAARDPSQTFQLVQALAGSGRDNDYLHAFMAQAHAAATGQALNASLATAQGMTYKAGNIINLANECFSSARAAGVPLDRSVAEGFERAARISGYNGNFTDAWQAGTGFETQFPGADPNWVGRQADRILSALGRRRRGADLDRYRRRY